MAATARAVATKRKSYDEDAQQKWLDKLVMDNSRLAHRLTNKPNKDFDTQQATNGGLGDDDHLEDVISKFSHLWNCDDQAALKEFAMTFIRLRDKLREERLAGRQLSLHQLQEKSQGRQ